MRNRVMVGVMVVTMLAAVGALISVGQTSASARRPREAGTRAAAAQSQTASRSLVSGRVLDPEGNPVAGAEVRAFGARQHIGKVPGAVTDENGAFVFEDLRPGAMTSPARRRRKGTEIRGAASTQPTASRTRG